MDAIFDMGASISIINLDLAKTLHLEVDMILPGLGVKVLDEQDIASEGAIINTFIWIGSRLYPDHLVVNKQMKPILLLGMS